jgi:uncharacterized protein YgbK (DUF1537 family)
MAPVAGMTNTGAAHLPEEVRAVQQRFGVERAGAMVEDCLALKSGNFGAADFFSHALQGAR